VLERATDDMRLLADRHDQPVSLIGWSLGGIYARELAKLHPELARCVVTLGTPFTGHPKSTNAWRIYELLTGSRVGDDDVMDLIRGAPPVPTTSLYSRTDGIVAWHCSLNELSPLAENIEVHASHVGLGMNPLALHAIADRLAQPIGQWRAFDPSGARRRVFRTGPSTTAAAAG
jgi:pimeloyl-ACP methyl ester carboxylesterase